MKPNLTQTPSIEPLPHPILILRRIPLSRLLSIFLLRNPLHDKLLHVGKVLRHHRRQPVDLRADNVPKPALHDLPGQIRIRPAGVVVGDIDLRVLLIPRGQVAVDIRLDGPERAVDEVDDTCDAGFDVDWI